VFDRDEFKDAMFEALGWSDRDWSVRVGSASWELLGLCIDRLTRSGVSLIAESNFRPTDPFVGRLRQLCVDTNTTAIGVYCTASHDLLWERFQSRRRAGGRHPGHAGYEKREAFLRDLEARPHGPLDLGGPLIQVNTSDSWPNVRAISDQIAALAR
jgi:hypothetical protein